MQTYPEEYQEQTLSRNKSSLIIEPTYGYADCGEIPHKPSLKEIFIEWLDAVNFVKDFRRFPVFFFALFHFLTFLIFIAYFLFYLSFYRFSVFIFFTFFFSTVFNTIWYHRYCSHRAFTFKRPRYTALFLLTNPVSFREESYAIPHQIHHRRTDKSGDPYGPHLGWLGSYLATESQQKLNTKISSEEYLSLKKSIEHIGLKTNSFEDFQRTGSVEKLTVYFCRVFFAQIFWMILMLVIGGIKLLITWYAALFFFTFLLRDFNWRGHGGNFRWVKKARWEFYENCSALNQHFYGYLASEWHDNHHNYPMSANNNFIPGQIDIAFLIIKFLKRVHIIDSYVDAAPAFRKKFMPNETSSLPEDSLCLGDRPRV